jgi:hypothetical protein
VTLLPKQLESTFVFVMVVWLGELICFAFHHQILAD